MNPPSQLPCTDCDGTLHLISLLAPDELLEPGSVLAYRCDSCMERFDLVWEEPQTGADGT
ncbi:MAG TPA: hypothetical protein VLA54_12805 [Acidimicrobiia bacterium]|jgi:hypothetical protein|nr:hypothetical protein [Acidimicrobiia bacterium]